MTPRIPFRFLTTRPMTGKTSTPSTPLALPLLLALGLGWPLNPLLAQEAARAPAAAAPSDMPLLQNGIAPRLKATARRPAAKPGEPYKPIEKQDDAGQVPEIELFAGESRVFPTPGVGRIAVGNGNIMTAAVLDDKETIIFGNAPGTTSLFIWNADGRYQRLKVNVVPGDTAVSVCPLPRDCGHCRFAAPSAAGCSIAHGL